MIGAYRSYKTGRALKLHFTTNYNYFKYSGKCNTISYDDFQHKSEKALWERFSKRVTNKQQCEKFMVSQLLNDPDSWLWDWSEEVFIEWKKRTESLDYTFKQEIQILEDFCTERQIKFTSLFECVSGNHPPIFKLLLQKLIGIETFIILDKLTGMMNQYLIKLHDDCLYQKWYKKCTDYAPFLELSSNEVYMSIVMKIIKGE